MPLPPNIPVTAKDLPEQDYMEVEPVTAPITHQQRIYHQGMAEG